MKTSASGSTVSPFGRLAASRAAAAWIIHDVERIWVEQGFSPA
jgi:hypothetical protein